MFDKDQFEIEGLRFMVSIPRDEFSGSPWKESDGHGPVTDWTRRDKRPGERVLSSDRDSKRYYDYAEAVKIALRDGWGVKDSEGKTKNQIAAESAEQDFQRLKAWCNDEWCYVGVIVTLLDVHGNATEVTESLWGIESDDEEYLEETAKELAGQIASRFEGEDTLVIPIRKDGKGIDREGISAKLAAHYSEKHHGTVTCTWDEEKHAYCIHGAALPAAPEMQSLYPNGWTMIDYVSPKKAQDIINLSNGKEKV